MKPTMSLIYFLLPVLSNSYYFKRTIYGDANEFTPDLVSQYYGISFYPGQHEQNLPNIYPTQHGFIRRENPFDFRGIDHKNFRNFGNANIWSDRQRSMEHAKPGVWKKYNRENALTDIKGIIERRKNELKERRTRIQSILTTGPNQLKEKFADLHKKLLMKNKKIVEASSLSKSTTTTTAIPTTSIKPDVNETKLLEKNEETFKLNNEMKNEKQSEILMVKAPNSLENPTTINDLSKYPSQQVFGSIVESKPIRVSSDGKIIQI